MASETLNEPVCKPTGKSSGMTRSLSIGPPDGLPVKVDVHVVETGGEAQVNVTVRTESTWEHNPTSILLLREVARSLKIPISIIAAADSLELRLLSLLVLALPNSLAPEILAHEASTLYSIVSPEEVSEKLKALSIKFLAFGKYDVLIIRDDGTFEIRIDGA